MKTYKNDAFASIHGSASALHEIGAIDKTTMKEFDETCLSALADLSPNDIKAIRETQHLSQGVFARYLNVSKNQISEWERGKKKPSGTAIKLLTLVKERGIDAIA